MNCNTIRDDDGLDSNWNLYSMRSLDYYSDYCNYLPNLVRQDRTNRTDCRTVECNYTVDGHVYFPILNEAKKHSKIISFGFSFSYEKLSGIKSVN